MKKITTMLVLMILTLALTGCGNSLVDKSIEQSKAAIENKEYDKALLSLELALDEDKENKEANMLYSIVENYQKASNLIDENNINEAKNILDEMNPAYNNYSIKEDIDELKVKIDECNKEIEKIDEHIKKAQEMYDNAQYVECKMYLGSNILGSQPDESIEPNKYVTEDQEKRSLELVDKCEKAIAEEEAKVLAEKEKNQKAKGTKDEYIEKLNNVELGLSDLDYLYEDGGTTASLIEGEGLTLKRWDDMLNEIYNLLKVQLSKTEMSDLTDKQISWIKYRDITAKNAASVFGEGSSAGIQYNSSLAMLTKERCYELVNTYMK